MPSRKNRKSSKAAKAGNTDPPLENISVKLKPIIGISPRTYVPAAWVLIMSFIIFILLILPGIRKNGTELTVLSVPADAQVIFNGIRIGSTGQVVFAARGTGELVVSKPGFVDFREERTIRGRIFASRIFPRKETIVVRLNPEKDFNAVKSGIEDYTAWVGTGPAIDAYAIPPSLTLAVRDYISSGKATREHLVIARQTLPLGIDERHLADILRSEILLAGNGAPVHADSLVALIGAAAEAIDDSPVIAEGISLMIDSERLDGLGLSGITESQAEEVSGILQSYSLFYDETRRSYSSGELVSGGISFTGFKALNAPVGDIEVVSEGYTARSGASPAIVGTRGFYMAKREITNNEFSVFLNARPDWSVDNREKLIGEGLADKSYLADWSAAGPAPGTGRKPVTGISWYAAGAYTRWFTERYLTGRDLEARLPTGNEWEIAARMNDEPDNTSELPASLLDADGATTGLIGIRGMGGNVREWCSDPYFHYANRFLTSDGSSAFPDAGNAGNTPRTVRGGAFIDSKLPYPAAVRGSLPPDQTSPVIGFRLVISEPPRS